MPFDGSTLLASSPQDLLDAAFLESGLRPIDRDILERHKAQQVAEHPPGWLYRHGRMVQLAQAAVLLAGIGVFFMLCTADRYGAGVAASLVAFALAVAPLLIPFHGPAQWRERADEELREVHPRVRDAALRLKARLPETAFTVGELFQDRIRLDPYLVADYRGRQIVLGIWDGDRLIACA